MRSPGSSVKKWRHSTRRSCTSSILQVSAATAGQSPRRWPLRSHRISARSAAGSRNSSLWRIAGGSGWVLLSYLPRDARLINHRGGDHNQTVAGAIPLLALDMYEHAYHLEFGANTTAYIAAFMRNIEWNAVQARYQDALEVKPPRPLEQKQFADLPHVTVEEVRAMLKAGEPVQIIDTRPKHYAAKAHEIMEGATWRDPERVEEWMGELSKSEPVVTFCVYGFHIGCETAATLRKAGFDARYMAGGHYAWKAAKGAMKLLD